MLQEIADDDGGVGFTSHRRCQHEPCHTDPVPFDDPGQHGAQLVRRRVVGVVTELLDGVGERGVREDEREALHRPVDATLGCCLAYCARRRRTAGQPLDRFPVIVVETFDHRFQLLVGGGPEGAIEQAEGLQPRSHLVHAARRYRRLAMTIGETRAHAVRGRGDRASPPRSPIPPAIEAWTDRMEKGGCDRSVGSRYTK